MDHERLSATRTPDATVAPVTSARRVGAIDVVRGFALLGILVPNIWAFAWPWAAQEDPRLIGELIRVVVPGAEPHTASNLTAGVITSVFFLGKFMCLFAMLFGAGVVFFDRKTRKGRERATIETGAGLWYTRMGWLLVFGLIHAFCFWYGDILVWYAVCGLVLVWWMRRLQPVAQLITASAMYLFGVAVLVGITLMLKAGIESGQMPADAVSPNPLIDIEIYRSADWLGMTLHRGGQLLMWYLIIPLTFFWMITGLMLAGMGLTKLGFLTGERSARFYAAFAGVAIPLGLLTTVGGYLFIHSLGTIVDGMLWTSVAQFFGIPLSLGYAACLLWLVKVGVWTPLTTALAAVGRMALTNYFLHTLICTTLFYGYGVGLFGSVQFPALFGVVLTVWAVNIAFSLLWLRYFRFGPFEWVWRSLTYLTLQPMRRDTPTAA